MNSMTPEFVSARLTINTSAMIEAAIVGRPVCSILADEFAGLPERALYMIGTIEEVASRDLK